jgi:hypothetical protein
MDPPSLKAPPFDAYKGMYADTGAEDDDLIEDDTDDEELEDEGEDMEASMKGLTRYANKAMSIPEDGEDLDKNCSDKEKETGVAKKGKQSALEAPGMHGAAQGSGMAKSKLDAFVSKMTETRKALTTRSMYIPRPTSPYDPFEVQSNASKATTRGHSALRGPEGTAPLIGETFEKLAEDEQVRTRVQPDTYKSCSVHGISYRLGGQCHPCSVMKSMSCKSCGGQMVKAAAGSMKCASCGR